jgi:hypothetical protein
MKCEIWCGSTGVIDYYALVAIFLEEWKIVDVFVYYEMIGMRA